MHAAAPLSLVVSVRERRRTFYCQTKVRPIVVVVRLPSDFGRNLEILGGRRRRRLPFEASGRPGVRSGNGAVTHGPDKIHHGKQIAEGEDGSSRGGHYVEHLKFRGIAGIAARHAHVSKNELREKCEIEAEEKSDGGDTRKEFRVELASNLRPPEVQAADVTHHRASHHDVVEVSDHEISVV